jgi:hypothetical protein
MAAAAAARPRRARIVMAAAAAVLFAWTPGCRAHSKTPAGPPPPPEVGAHAVPLALGLETLDRVPTTLVTLRGARATVVNFFTTGSDDALLLVDALAAVDEGWTAYGVRVVGVALDANADLVGPYVAGARIPYTVLLATADVREGRSALGPVYAVPLTLVLDAAGRIRFYHYGIVKLPVLETELDRLRVEATASLATIRS